MGSVMLPSGWDYVFDRPRGGRAMTRCHELQSNDGRSTLRVMMGRGVSKNRKVDVSAELAP